jgi:cytochrome c-type biogenesis protein CcmH/NrfG
MYLLVCVVSGLFASPEIESLARELSAARTEYRPDAAQAALEKARVLSEQDASAEVVRLHVDAALLVAELQRIEWEQLPESNIAKRRPLGAAIDEAAEEAIALLDRLPENSERYRLHADLLGVMIRSDFRAKKYRKTMEEYAAKALQLDPANPNAYVSQAKPYIFAAENEGGDPMKAVELLSKALEADPTHEPARCLRGLAYQRAGKLDLARADWETALARNPKCSPAAKELENLERR